MSTESHSSMIYLNYKYIHITQNMILIKISSVLLNVKLVFKLMT